VAISIDDELVLHSADQSKGDDLMIQPRRES
jgi:hypothetical protein